MNRNKMERLAKRVVRRASRTILRDRRPYDMAYAAYARVFADAAMFTDYDVRYYRERHMRKALRPSQRNALHKAEARLFHARLAVQDVRE